MAETQKNAQSVVVDLGRHYGVVRADIHRIGKGIDAPVEAIARAATTAADIYTNTLTHDKKVEAVRAELARMNTDAYAKEALVALVNGNPLQVAGFNVGGIGYAAILEHSNSPRHEGPHAIYVARLKQPSLRTQLASFGKKVFGLKK
jgi:hypothetical protein